MSIKIEKTENNNELKLEFTIEAKKFDEAIIKVFNKSAKYFNIPGFRKGKAPFNIVERMYGDEIFYEDAFNELVPSIYEKEIEDNKLDVVSKPEINIVKMKKGEDLVFTAIVQTKPEVKLGKYKGVELKKVEYPVTDEDVEHEIAHMQEHNARTITVDDRPVKEKDIAVIDFDGYVDGKAFEGGKAENHELEIGSGAFIPGFEEQIIGMKTGEEKEIKVKFPEKYFSEDLAGKEATFKVKVNEIKEKLEKAASVVMVDARGLTVEQDTALRKQLRDAGVDYKVYKNTMMHFAIQGTEFEGLDEYLAGPSAFAFSYEDATAGASILNKVAKDVKELEFKAGVVEGVVYDAEGMKKIADIPSRDVLLSKLLGSFKSPLSSFARVIDQIAKKDAAAE